MSKILEGGLNMTNNVLLSEIKEFKSSVVAGGMLIIDYVQKSKQIKHKIDAQAENSMKFFRCLLFLDKISMEQYLTLKSRVDESRIYYKRLLYFN